MAYWPEMTIYPWQQAQWQQLTRQRRQNRLAHALLFEGPAGTGKKQCARELAHALLCTQTADDGSACGGCDACKLIAAGTHPDLHLLLPTPPASSTSSNPVLSIKIDALRAMYRALSETSQFGGYRVAVIEDADKMPVQAANSLLKTLEEPGENTLLILVSSHPHRLPVTIRSRCQSTRFQVPDTETAASWLAEGGISQVGNALKLAHGAPLRAKDYIEHHAEQRELLVKALNAATRGEASIHYAQKLAQMPRDYLLAWLLDWVSDIGRLLTCGEATELVNEDQRAVLEARARTADKARVFSLHDHIISLLKAEGIALNPQLLWENLLISFENL
ncbi:MAG: DNA polymerase III subunit delta' [Thiotrichales bacterium]|nr:MAG: DNA polymerase III subunit delta' [Thiotrichales bacterium]